MKQAVPVNSTQSPHESSPLKIILLFHNYIILDLKDN